MPGEGERSQEVALVGPLRNQVNKSNLPQLDRTLNPSNCGTAGRVSIISACIERQMQERWAAVHECRRPVRLCTSWATHIRHQRGLLTCSPRHPHNCGNDACLPLQLLRPQYNLASNPVAVRFRGPWVEATTGAPSLTARQCRLYEGVQVELN